MRSAKLPHLPLGRAVPRAVFASEPHCSQSQPKHFAWLLCIATFLIPRFNKRVLDKLQLATAGVAECCALGVGANAVCSGGAATFPRPIGRST